MNARELYETILQYLKEKTLTTDRTLIEKIKDCLLDDTLASTGDQERLKAYFKISKLIKEIEGKENE